MTDKQKDELQPIREQDSNLDRSGYNAGAATQGATQLSIRHLGNVMDLSVYKVYAWKTLASLMASEPL